MHVDFTLRIVQRVAYAGTGKDTRVSFLHVVQSDKGYKAPYLAAGLLVGIKSQVLTHSDCTG